MFKSLFPGLDISGLIFEYIYAVLSTWWEIMENEELMYRPDAILEPR